MPFQSAFSQLFTQDTIIAWVVFGLVILVMTGAMGYSWYRGRKGRGPLKLTEANRLELGYVGALAGMVVFLVISSFSANAKDYPSPPKPAATVTVTGYQWCWRFHYNGTRVTATGQCQGLRSLPVLVVPAGEPVRLDLTSTDVIHAVWLPQWDFKLYAYPGHVASATLTIPRAGTWMNRCAQLCGLYHYEMDFYLRAVPPATFQSYLRTGRL
ncbi:MAG TPA: cytochrome c oxidase subunit II [Trebonia sp.]